MPDIQDSTRTKEFAESLDLQDPLRFLREEFHIPSRADLRSKSLPEPGEACPVMFLDAMISTNATDPD
jgi:hypothetical protein